jgi:hypothetical protein
MRREIKEKKFCRRIVTKDKKKKKVGGERTKKSNWIGQR